MSIAKPKEIMEIKLLHYAVQQVFTSGNVTVTKMKRRQLLPVEIHKILSQDPEK